MRKALFWTIFAVILWAAPSWSLSQPRIPLTMPFEFDFNTGGISTSETDFIPKLHGLPTTTNGSYRDTLQEDVTIDTSIVGSKLFYSGDTINWVDTVYEGTTCYRSYEFRLVFDTTHSILKYLYSRDHLFCENGDDGILTCENIPYTADTLVAGWPFGSKDVGSVSSSDWTITEDMSGTTMKTNSFSGTVLSISGHLATKAAVISQSIPQYRGIRFSNHPSTCSFNPSDQSRTLEVYSLLGVRIVRLEIAPNQQSVSLPRIGAALYFLRLDGEITKAYIPPE